MRLEQQDAYRTRFESEVAAVETRDGAVWATLSASAFYPTSGGQAHDTGTLEGPWGAARVTDVVKRESGERVWHRLDGDVPRPGDPAEGAIDWERRYRHMQRHTAQHLLSQAFVRLSPAFATRSVSLGGPPCTVDLAGDPGEEALAEAERRVNEVGYHRLPVRAFEVDEGELARYPLRRPAKVEGRVRLVVVGGPVDAEVGAEVGGGTTPWELSACGGTHVASSAEVLPVKLLRSERIRGDLVRVSFVAGLDALDDYRLKHAVASEAAAAFSARVESVPERLSALRDELAAFGRERGALEAALAAERAASLLSAARRGDTVRRGGDTVVDAVLGPAEAFLLRPLADALVASPGVVALLGAEEGDRARLLFARSEDADGDMRALLAAVLPRVEGRGGGRPERAQGAGARPAGLHEALADARRALDG